MAEVVVLSWDAAARALVYVPVDGGNGGEARSLAVSEEYAADVGCQCEAMSLPRVGDLLAEGDDCLLELSGPAATVCSARWKKPSVRLCGRHSGDQVAELAPEAVGLAHPDLAAHVENIGSFLFSTGPTPTVSWGAGSARAGWPAGWIGCGHAGRNGPR
jgi:hypothetical protein